MLMKMPSCVRYIVVILCCFLMLTTAVAAMWYQDAQYAAPTPRPAGLCQRPISSRLSLPTEVFQNSGTDHRPLLLHFFNPDCPCSRFNLDHIRLLVRAYGARVRFVAILQGDDEAYLQRAFRETGLKIPCVADVRGEIARKCGVYSTPQAVVLTGDGRLYYRGNYNLARYCADPGTEFARLAIVSVLAGNPTYVAPSVASVSYGCALPASHVPRQGP